MKKVLSALIITIIFSAAGFWLRGYLLKNIYDASGLPVRGHPANTALIVLCVVFLCLLASLVFTTRCERTPELTARLSSVGTVSGVFGILGGAAMAVGGALVAVAPATRLDLFLGLAAIAAGICALLAVLKAMKGKLGKASGLLSADVIFSCFWLVCSFREYGGSDPVLQNYAYIILAEICCVLGFYFMSGLAYGVPRPLMLVYFSMTASFFCAINLAESFSLGLLLIFAANFVYLLSLSCSVLRKLGSE